MLTLHYFIYDFLKVLIFTNTLELHNRTKTQQRKEKSNKTGKWDKTWCRAVWFGAQANQSKIKIPLPSADRRRWYHNIIIELEQNTQLPCSRSSVVSLFGEGGKMRHCCVVMVVLLLWFVWWGMSVEVLWTSRGVEGMLCEWACVCVLWEGEWWLVSDFALKTARSYIIPLLVPLSQWSFQCCAKNYWNTM